MGALSASSITNALQALAPTKSALGYNQGLLARPEFALNAAEFGPHALLTADCTSNAANRAPQATERGSDQ